MPPLNPRSNHLNLILPLCTSSATLGLSLFQYPLFSSFLQPTKPSKQKTKHPNKISGTPFSHFWSTFLAPSASLIAALNLASASSGLLAARWLHSQETLETAELARYYLLGAALALGHLAFVPAVAGPIQTITGGLREEEVSEEAISTRNEEAMRTWFAWHSIRTVFVDLPALVCFAEGVALSFVGCLRWRGGIWRGR